MAMKDVSMSVKVTKARVASSNKDEESMNSICGGISFYIKNKVVKFGGEALSYIKGWKRLFLNIEYHKCRDILAKKSL